MPKNLVVILFFVTSLRVWAGSNVCSEFYTTAVDTTRTGLARNYGEQNKSATAIYAEQKDIDRVIDLTQDFDKKIQTMLNPFKRFEMEGLFFRQRSRGDSPRYFSFYRNSNFLSEAEFLVVKFLPSNSKMLKRVEFGYQNLHNEKVKQLGIIPAVELDANGVAKRFYFHSKEQMDGFRAHFLGRPFSKHMRASILDINTSIFEFLAAQPAAQAKVKEFEKKRGWPSGMAKNLGLVYFSTDIIQLKRFAKIKNFSLEDLASAGWLKPYMQKDGSIAYRENYDNSIKIPFYDETNPGKIAFWRTRNLDTSGGRPKYLSWPKDRSLYEEAPLFEEFYNSWNLAKAKGKQIVLTEGEFKCAIGENMTGVFHLGLPGIGQFQAAMLEKIVRAEPSDVVVLFDRDPIGKGLMRIDEATDSQRASFLIAKQIEAAGIPVRVATLPDLYNGKKMGIDDLLLSHGAAPYLKSLEDAILPNEYATAFNIDTTLTFLSDRKSKVRNALLRFDIANASSAGSVELIQRSAYQDLTHYQQILESTFQFYMARVYPNRRNLNDPSHHFSIIAPKVRNTPLRIESNDGDFETASALLKIVVIPFDSVKSCAEMSCFSVGKSHLEWVQLTEAQRGDYLKTALGTVFPLDDYTYIEKPSLDHKQYALLVIRKEARTPVALIEQF